MAGLVMFEMMLGLSKVWALAITTAILLGYVTLGGAHADILTDSAQGLLMVALALAILIMFLFGVGSDGLGNLLENLRSQDPQFVQNFNPATAITASVWAYVSLVIAHIPLGLLPHIGNKLWALKDERSQTRFLVMAFTFGLILPAITLGGALARGVLGDTLISGGGGANRPCRRYSSKYSQPGSLRCSVSASCQRSCPRRMAWSFRHRKYSPTIFIDAASRPVSTRIRIKPLWIAMFLSSAA